MGSNKLRLFCFPYAGGGRALFNTWENHLSPNIELVKVDLPGRDSLFKAKPVSRMPEMIDFLLETLEPQMDIPFAFYGHSMGALLSYELTRQLERQGKRMPKVLLLSSFCAVHYLESKELYKKNDEDFIKALKDIGGIPKEITDQEIITAMLPILRADFELCETYLSYYKEEEPLQVPIQAFGGWQDTLTPKPSIEGWEKYTESFQCTMFPGGHFFLKDSAPTFLWSLNTILGGYIQ